MAKVIIAKFVGPTNAHGTHILAKLGATRMRVPYDHKLDYFGNCAAAAKQLAEKLELRGQWVAGDMENNSFVFVMLWYNKLEKHVAFNSKWEEGVTILDSVLA